MPSIRPAVPARLAVLASVALLVVATADSACGAPPVDEDRGMPPAPLDYGYGPNVKPTLVARTKSAVGAAATELVAWIGGSRAHLEGAFGPPVTWPVVGTHNVLLPDGRVLSYGPLRAADRRPENFVYDVWDPALGTGSEAHLVLPNTTPADFFCSGQTLIAATGQVFMTGGDRTVDGVLNKSHERTAFFDPARNRVGAGGPMAYRRWYPTLVTLPGGGVLALGGREDIGVPVTVPEVYHPSSGWRMLTGAASAGAFGRLRDNWYYPRAWLAPSGRVVVVGYDGSMWSVDTAGAGAVNRFATTTRPGNYTLPSVMYAPGKILSLRAERWVVSIDINGATPRSDEAGRLAQQRLWSQATVLADGKVLLTGGSAVWNKLQDVAYHVELWDPATNIWARGAVAAKERLYHASALLLADGTVLTVGGGLPGPITQFNAEIYYPPYLFEPDGSGGLAARPTITGGATEVAPGTSFTVQVGAGQTIRRATLVRAGSDTHSLNADQRFFNRTVSQAGRTVTLKAPPDRRVAPPGYYLLFVFNERGTPSHARIVKLI